MAQIAVTAAQVRPANANQCIIRQVVSGEAIDVGELVYLKPADDLAWLSAGGAAATAYAIGVVVAIGSQGQTTGVGAGEVLSVCMFGPIAGFTVGAGDLGYVSDTAGQLGTVAGTHVRVLGIGIGDNLFFINPGFGVIA